MHEKCQQITEEMTIVHEDAKPAARDLSADSSYDEPYYEGEDLPPDEPQGSGSGVIDVQSGMERHLLQQTMKYGP